MTKIEAYLCIMKTTCFAVGILFLFFFYIWKGWEIRSSDMSEVTEKCLVDMNVFQVALKYIINCFLSLWDTAEPFSSPWRRL